MRHAVFVCLCGLTALSLVLTACNYPSSSDRSPTSAVVGVPTVIAATVSVIEPVPTDTPPLTVELPLASEAPVLTEAPALTEVPVVMETSAPATLATATAAVQNTQSSDSGLESPPQVIFFLPEEAARRLERVAYDNGMQWNGIASEHTVIYAFPDERGIAYLLTPAGEMPRISPEDLAQDPSAIEGVVLGGLTVVNVDGMSFPLSEGDYVITLNPDGQTIEFTGEHESASFDAIVRSLPQRILPHQTALITATQMCLSQRRLEICANLSTPMPDDMTGMLDQAMNDLGVDPSEFAYDRAIPDIEGFRMVDRCVRALSQNPPAYNRCRATVLAVPAVGDGNLPPPDLPELQDAASVTSIAALVVLDHLRDQIYLDPQLTQPVPEMPPGPYLSYEILYPGESPEWGKPVDTRVMQSGPAGNYYLPATSSDVVLGEPLLGSGFSNEEEAVIINLIIRGRCIFKWLQCPNR